MHPRRRLPRFLIAFLISATARAADKNGVAPQAISLPSGPGSIQGLGESFQPQLNNGSGSTGLKLVVPRGPGGITPDLSLAYNSGGSNGSVGMGWSLSAMLSVRRSTDRGVPYYVDASDGLDNDSDGQIDNPEELDTFTGANGEELVTLPDGTFRAENESAFLQYRRSGAGWEARTRDGRRYLFGINAQARIEDSGRIFEWCLERVLDANGNSIDYEYMSDPAAPAQRHLRHLRWGSAQAYVALVLQYETGRPDVVTSYRSGFKLETGLRLSSFDIISHGLAAPTGSLVADLDGDGSQDALVRRYRLEYKAGAHLSLLERVTQLGYDGVTALPTLTYSYTPWTPPDQVAATLIRSRSAPAESFDSPSAELIDMNGDGLPDLLSTSANQHRVSLNLGVDAGGRLNWAPSRPVGNAPTIDISSDRTHLADATADGLSDLMVKVSNTSFLCFDNTSENSWINAPFPLRNTDTWPIWPYDGAGGALSRSFDSDYSRTNDILHTSQTGYQLWLLLPGGGRYSKELRFPPLAIDGQVFRFDLPGTHIADLNGDRLQDLAWIQSSRVIYFPNMGRGIFDEPVILLLGRSLSASEITRSDFSDIDGDGLVDLTVVRPSFQPTGVAYWLNRFQQGLDGPRTVQGLPAQQAGDGLRWADMNGNGTTDIVIAVQQAAPGENIVVVDLVPEGKPFLLREANNGLGLKIRMDYETSITQMVRAAGTATPWTTRMPLVVTVVGRITEDDGVSPPYVQSIQYRDPFYDPVKQEFRGFAAAEAREEGDASIAAKRARFVFDTGRAEPCLKGKQLSEEILGDDGKLFERSLTTWKMRILAEGVDGRRVCYPFEGAEDRSVHEGEPQGIQLRSEKDYDDFGNTVAERRLGIVGSQGDEVFIERAYELRVPEWRVDLLARETTFDGVGNKVAEQRHTYDARGNRVRTEAWLDTENRFIATLRQSFDEFGNVIETIDARGSRRTVDFDDVLHAWPTVETLHLADHDLEMTADYDLGLGVVTRSVSFSGELGTFAYDALARVIERQSPGGALETYEYRLDAPISRITKHGKEDVSGNALDAFVFYDGRGRELLTKLEAEGGKWRVVSARSFNGRKLEARKWLPYLSTTPEFEALDPGLPHNEKIYDAAGRVLEEVAPDGGRTRTVFSPLASQQLDAEDAAHGGNPNTLRFDGLERMVEVEERNGAEAHTTSYAWNARGELESITDALGNVKRFRFDSLGRLVEIDDPDRGLLRSAYDDAGNLLQRTDARGQVIAFSYDAANRSLEKVYRRGGQGGADLVESRWHFDAQAGVIDFGDGTSGTARNTAGRLAYAEDLSGETHYSYDERGNVEWVTKRVRDSSSGLLLPFRTQRRYDLLNRNVEITFPDNDVLRFEHGQGSFVTAIRGLGAGAKVILSGAEFTASGRPLRVQWGNGLQSRWEYDTSERLKGDRLLAAGDVELRHEQLTYDLNSSVVAIDDLRPVSVLATSSPRRTTARFTYDELHRLVRASHGADASLGAIDYSYDALGNLLSQSTPAPGQPGHLDDASASLGAVSYSGGRSGRQGRRPGDKPGPHALTSTASGHQLVYDANGNVTTYDAAQLVWDFEDRLARYSSAGTVADYVRDHSGRRVIRRGDRGVAREEVWTIDAACEVRVEGSTAAIVKYAFLDGRRVARIQGTLDPAREVIQSVRLLKDWNLVASAVETTLDLGGAFGADAKVYEATGPTSFAPLALTTPLGVGRALWVHIPSARLVTWRGLPRAIGAGVTSPGPLHAWPRPEAFRPALDVEGDPTLLFFSASMRRWLRRDSTVPSFLSDAPPELGSAQAFWSPGPVRFLPGTASSGSIVFYHMDAVGSVAAMTDSSGAMLEERAHYAFGAVRNLHRPGSPLAGTDHDFAGHERDRESGLVHMGARSYTDLAGVFLSPDPRFVAVAALAGGSVADKQSFESFLSNPQMGNLYGYALRSPLKYLDPDGLEPAVTFTKAASADPTFKLAWQAYASTQAGQRQLSMIKESGGTVVVNVYKQKSNVGSAAAPSAWKADVSFGIVERRGGATARDIENLAVNIYDQMQYASGPMMQRWDAAKQADRQSRVMTARGFEAVGVYSAAMRAQVELVARREALIDARATRLDTVESFERELKEPLQNIEKK